MLSTATIPYLFLRTAWYTFLVPLFIQLPASSHLTSAAFRSVSVLTKNVFFSTFFGTELQISSLAALYPRRIDTKEEVFSTLCLFDHSELSLWYCGLYKRMVWLKLI